MPGNIPLVSGEPIPTVSLSGGDAPRLIDAINRLDGYPFALIGGFAVMARLGAALRSTNDLDGVFDNPGDTPMVVQLVTAGVGEPMATGRAQSIEIAGTKFDVIDSQPLPGNISDLPDSAGDRLFVCAHRFGYESATPLRLVSGTHTTLINVATAPALVAMKAHAIRYAGQQRRSSKRDSDLFDLFQLVLTTGATNIATSLTATSWDLHLQVVAALADDISAEFESAAAALRRSTTPEIARTNSADFVEVITDLLEALVAE